MQAQAVKDPASTKSPKVNRSSSGSQVRPLEASDDFREEREEGDSAPLLESKENPKSSSHATRQRSPLNRPEIATM